jgi:hypothetical protein
MLKRVVVVLLSGAVPILDGALSTNSRTPMGIMISTPTLKSRTGEANSSLQCGHSQGDQGDRDAEINTMHALLNEMNMNESHEKVCRSWCRQTSVAYHSRRSMLSSPAMAEQVKIDTASMWVITRFLDGCLDAASRRDSAIGSDYFEATTFWRQSRR